MIYRSMCPACRGAGELSEIGCQRELFFGDTCRTCKGSGVVTLCPETLEPLRPHACPMHDVDPEAHADPIEETLANAGLD